MKKTIKMQRTGGTIVNLAKFVNDYNDLPVADRPAVEPGDYEVTIYKDVTYDPQSGTELIAEVLPEWAEDSESYSALIGPDEVNEYIGEYYLETSDPEPANPLTANLKLILVEHDWSAMTTHHYLPTDPALPAMYHAHDLTSTDLVNGNYDSLQARYQKINQLVNQHGLAINTTYEQFLQEIVNALQTANLPVTLAQVQAVVDFVMEDAQQGRISISQTITSVVNDCKAELEPEIK